MISACIGNNLYSRLEAVHLFVFFADLRKTNKNGSTDQKPVCTPRGLHRSKASIFKSRRLEWKASVAIPTQLRTTSSSIVKVRYVKKLQYIYIFFISFVLFLHAFSTCTVQKKSMYYYDRIVCSVRNANKRLLRKLLLRKFFLIVNCAFLDRRNGRFVQPGEMEFVGFAKRRRS